MISSPWSAILAVVFIITAVLCVAALVPSRSEDGKRSVGLHIAVHINHFVMSLCMLVMIWVASGSVWLWLQVGFFVVLGVAFLIGVFGSRGASGRIDLLGHTVLNGAMVWMLLAMPLLMAGSMDMGDGEMGHGGMEHGDMAMAMTPTWASAINWIFIGLMALLTIWWLVRIIRAPRHVVHLLCHLLMTAGMGAMLILM